MLINRGLIFPVKDFISLKTEVEDLRDSSDIFLTLLIMISVPLSIFQYSMYFVLILSGVLWLFL